MKFTINSIKFILFILFAALVLSFTSCKENSVVSNENTLGSQIRGSIKLLMEDNSYEIFKTGITVSVLGTGYATVTDTSGKWRLNLIPKGTYTLVYKKVGYSESRKFNVECDGINPVTINSVTIAQIPSFTVSNIESRIISDSIKIDCRISNVSQRNRNVILYFDSSNKVAVDPMQYLWTQVPLTILPNSDTGSITIPISLIKGQGINAGTKIYIAAYGIGRFEATPEASFISQDPTSGKSYFWNISSPAASTSFMVP